MHLALFLALRDKHRLEHITWDLNKHLSRQSNYSAKISKGIPADIKAMPFIFFLTSDTILHITLFEALFGIPVPLNMQVTNLTLDTEPHLN